MTISSYVVVPQFNQSVINFRSMKGYIARCKLVVLYLVSKYGKQFEVVQSTVLSKLISIGLVYGISKMLGKL